MNNKINSYFTFTFKNNLLFKEIGKLYKYYLIKVECMTAPFEYDQIQYSYWKDVNGSPQYFWAGDKSAQHTCQCGIDGNCQIDGSATPLPNVKCKCDYNSSSPQIDIGNLKKSQFLNVVSYILNDLRFLLLKDL